MVVGMMVVLVMVVFGCICTIRWECDGKNVLMLESQGVASLMVFNYHLSVTGSRRTYYFSLLVTVREATELIDDF